MPAYRSTDSHPYHQNHMAFSHYNQPVMEGFPPQIYVDPSKSPSAYEQTRPYIGGHSFPTPVQFCCGHHRFPGYWTYTPAYPHIPASSPPMCFSGGYPAYPEPFYVPYAPPPHYTVELPRYEYDKCMPREHHCCGCPNYPLNHEEGKGVKIEEHEPDSEKKVNNAVSPSQLQNYPFPCVWMPPQYMDNKERKTPDAKEVGNQHDTKPSEKRWNGWFPLDINSLANMIQDGNGRQNKNRQIDNGEDDKTNPTQQSERNKREFPFPVIWIPNYNMQEDGRAKDQESDSSPNSVTEVPRALKSSDDTSNRSNVNGNDLKVGGSDVTRNETDERNIHMKQMELPKSEPESHEKRVRDIPVKQIGDMTGKETQTSVKRQSDSPKKTSRLPPVCLRVDPLPRKKNGDGSSRSPSPSKKGSAASTNGTSKSSSSSSMHDKALEDAKHQHASDISVEFEPKEKTIEVVEMPSEKKDGEQRDRSESHCMTQALQKDSNSHEDFKPKSKSTEVLEKSSERKLEDHIDGTQSQVTSNNNTEVHKDSSALTSRGESGNEAERKVNEMIKEEAIEAMDAKDAKERKVLSDTEAATLIQAAYRGFQVRKWDPLKKLKLIAAVSKHVTDVRGSIQALEVSSSNKQIDEKENVTIAETIMRLLLKLDTIQGLHPSLREMRKSLARELTSLQEKLDSVVAKKSQLHMEDLSMGKLMTSTVGSNGEYMQKQPEEEASMAGRDSSEGIIPESHGCSEQHAEEIAASENSPDNIIHTSQDMVEQGQDKLSIKSGNSSNDDEKLQFVAHSLPVDDGKCASSSPIDQVFNEKPEPLPEGTNNEALSKFSEVEASGCDISELQPKTKSELEDIPNEADELDMKAWEELPQGVIDDLEADNIDFRKDKENEIEGEELQISKVTNTSGDDFAQDGESSKMREMEELPIGLLDDDTTDSENHEETRTPAQVLQSEGGELTHSSAYNIFKETQLDQLQQQLEKQKEYQSDGKSDEWVKVECEQDGLKRDALGNEKVETVSRGENVEQSVNDGHGVANEDACLGVKEVTVTETTEEEVAVKEEESEQVIKDDAGKMGEQCVISPLPKKDGEMGTDRNLIEENEKLRKMMQKLLEAGNEQLTLISNLTGRVKDLEKKLAKKKRVKTIHCRPTTSKPSFKKSSNNQLHDRITELAM